MGLKRSRAALAGGTMASVLGAAIGAALVVGAILGLVVFPGAPRGTGSPQPAIVLPEGGTAAAQRTATRPRTVQIAAAVRTPSRRRPRANPGATPRGKVARGLPSRMPSPAAATPARRAPATTVARRPAPAAAPDPAPAVADAVRPVSPAAAAAVQGAVDTATGAVGQASGALPPLPKTG
jgi:hypothetical protein